MKKAAKKRSLLSLTDRLSCSLAKAIAKPSILPATIFSKNQVALSKQEFNRFWGFDTKKPDLNPHEKFGTFTLKQPKSLWIYYFPNEESIHNLKKTYEPIPFKIRTDHHTKICGMRFKYKGHPKQHKRYLIVFNGNGELYRLGAHAWLFKLLKDLPDTSFDIIMFDHRECGFSSGKAHAKGLVKDGEAVYDFVKNTLGATEDQIDLCGFSLGAAIATLVKAKHPDTKGALISNRSFQSLDHAVQGFFTTLSKPLKTILGPLAKKIALKSGWTLDPLEAWKNITSRKMVIVHEKDPVIHHSASLEKGLKDAKLLTNCHLINLKQKNPHQKIKNHHVQPLSFYNDQEGHDVENQIKNFLLGHNSFSDLTKEQQLI